MRTVLCSLWWYFCMLLMESRKHPQLYSLVHYNQSKKGLISCQMIANCVIFWPSTRPKEMLFQGDAPEGSDTFQWPVIERDGVGGLRLMIWDTVKVPLCQYRLIHRNRVTSELHDSYFRLMTIKHSISKIQWAIVWALNYYLTQLSSSSRSSCQ